MKRGLSYAVNKLEQGSVLDHLHAGTSLRALRVLRFPADAMVMVGVNLTSKRHGKKDIIKIRGYELSEHEAAKIALISPNATLCIIRDFRVIEKIDLRPPLAFKGLIVCPNQACIVHSENVPGSFILASHDPLSLRCEYCERTIRADDAVFA